MSEDKILNSVPIKKFKKKVFNWAQSQSQTQTQNKENSYNLLNPSTVITKTNSTHEDNNKFMIDQKFALSLLKYEMELECVNSISNELHMKLLDLYEHGKEFYKLKKDKRQVYFNKKIKSLQKLMQNPSRSSQMQIKSIDNIKKKQFERLIQFKCVEVDQKIYNIIKSAEVMQQFEKSNKKKIEDNLKKQNQTIKKRIQKRKQSLKALSNITNNITEESETQNLINSNLKSRGIVSLGNSRIQQYHDI